MSHAVYSRFRVEEVPARKMCTTLTAGSVNSKQRKHVLILTITLTLFLTLSVNYTGGEHV